LHTGFVYYTQAVFVAVGVTDLFVSSTFVAVLRKCSRD